MTNLTLLFNTAEVNWKTKIIVCFMRLCFNILILTHTVFPSLNTTTDVPGDHEYDREDCPANVGTVFVIAYIENKRAGYDMQIYLSTPLGKNVNVSITTPKWNSANTVKKQVTVSPGSMLLVKLPEDLRLQNTGIYNQTAVVSADDVISVVLTNAQSGTAGSSLILPVDDLGNEYFLVSWINDARAAIIAVEESTHVTLQLPETYEGTIEYKSINYSAGAVIDIILEQYEVFHLSSNSDFTGTRLFSDKAVSVFSGNYYVYIDSNIGDHAEEQLIPVSEWQTEYVVLPIPESSKGEYIRILASRDNTNVMTSHDGSSVVLEKTADFFEFYLEFNETMFIQASNPVAIFQFGVGKEISPETGDSMVFQSPSPQSFRQSIDFVTPADELENPYTHRVTIITEYMYKDTILLDGQHFNSPWKNISGTNFVSTWLEVPLGYHTIHSDDTKARIGGFVDGYTFRESYAIPLTMSFSIPKLRDVNPPFWYFEKMWCQNKHSWQKTKWNTS